MKREGTYNRRDTWKLGGALQATTILCGFYTTKAGGEIETNDDSGFWPHSLFGPDPALASYNVNLEARTCSYR